MNRGKKGSFVKERTKNTGTLAFLYSLGRLVDCFFYQLYCFKLHTEANKKKGDLENKSALQTQSLDDGVTAWPGQGLHITEDYVQPNWQTWKQSIMGSNASQDIKYIIY